jgi:hypothetical protein
VTAAGIYNSPTVIATQVGTYVWHASYTGDGLNNGKIDDGTNESLTTIKASPAILLLDMRLRFFLGFFWYFSRLLKLGQPKSSWTEGHLIFAFIDHLLAECVLADAFVCARVVYTDFYFVKHIVKRLE